MRIELCETPELTGSGAEVTPTTATRSRWSKYDWDHFKSYQYQIQLVPVAIFYDLIGQMLLTCQDHRLYIDQLDLSCPDTYQCNLGLRASLLFLPNNVTQDFP